MKKKIIGFSLAALLVAAMMGLPAYADHGRSSCPLKDGNCYQGKCCASKGQGGGGCPITQKLMYKAYFFLENQKELGLKDDQVKAIKSIKMEAKKAHIRQKAEMQIFQLDVKAKLSENPVDVEGINKMIDSASAGMAASGKETVALYAKLKGVLTADQMAKAKEIWQKQ